MTWLIFVCILFSTLVYSLLKTVVSNFAALSVIPVTVISVRNRFYGVLP